MPITYWNKGQNSGSSRGAGISSGTQVHDSVKALLRSPAAGSLFSPNTIPHNALQSPPIINNWSDRIRSPREGQEMTYIIGSDYSSGPTAWSLIYSESLIDEAVNQRGWWYFQGGAPIYEEVNGTLTITSGSFNSEGNAGPTITGELPNGVYHIGFGIVSVPDTSAGASFARAQVYYGESGSMSAIGHYVGADFASGSGSTGDQDVTTSTNDGARLTYGISDNRIQMYYANNGSGGACLNRWVSVVPRRVEP